MAKKSTEKKQVVETVTEEIPVVEDVTPVEEVVIEAPVVEEIESVEATSFEELKDIAEKRPALHPNTERFLINTGMRLE